MAEMLGRFHAEDEGGDDHEPGAEHHNDDEEPNSDFKKGATTVVTQPHAASSSKADDDCSDLTDHNNPDGEEATPKSFPQKLLEVLSNESHTDIISWLPHGNGFIIHKKKTFASEVLPKYFKASKFTSFTRKLNRWGFSRIPRGPEAGAYFHKLFRRDKPDLSLQMTSNSGNKYQSAPLNQQLLPNVPNMMGVMSAAPGFPPMFPYMASAANPMMANLTPPQQQAWWQQQMQQMMQFQQMQMMQMQQMQQHQQQAPHMPVPAPGQGMPSAESLPAKIETDSSNAPVDQADSSDIPLAGGTLQNDAILAPLADSTPSSFGGVDNGLSLIQPLPLADSGSLEEEAV